MTICDPLLTQIVTLFNTDVGPVEVIREVILHTRKFSDYIILHINPLHHHPHQG
jgi:hypothetical protein